MSLYIVILKLLASIIYLSNLITNIIFKFFIKKDVNSYFKLKAIDKLAKKLRNCMKT